MHVGTDGSPPPAPTAEGRAGPPSGSAAAPPAIRPIEPPGPWYRHLVVSGSEPARPTARPTVLGHGALCGAQLVLGLLLLGGVFGAVRSHADDFKMCTVDAGQTVAFTEGLSRSIAQLPTQGGTDPVSEGQKQRLQFQLNELHRGQMMACRVGSFFFAGRIATLSLSTAAGILALASLAMISKQGWEKTHPVLINIGITTGLVLYSSWTFSQLFGQTANYEIYRSKYSLAYDTRNSVASAVANGQMTLEGEQAKVSVVSLRSRSGMAELILFVDGRMRQVTNPEISGETGFVESAAERLGRLGGYGSPSAPAAMPPMRSTNEAPLPVDQSAAINRRSCRAGRYAGV